MPIGSTLAHSWLAGLFVQGIKVLLLEALLGVGWAGLRQLVWVGSCEGFPAPSLGGCERVTNIQGLLEDGALLPKVPMARVGLGGARGSQETPLFCPGEGLQGRLSRGTGGRGLDGDLSGIKALLAMVVGEWQLPAAGQGRVCAGALGLLLDPGGGAVES